MFVFRDIRLLHQLRLDHAQLEQALAQSRLQSLQADLSLNLVRLLEPSFTKLRAFGPGDLNDPEKRDLFFQSRERVREGLSTFLRLIRREEKPGPLHLNQLIEELLPLIKNFLSQDRISLVLDLDQNLPAAYGCSLNLQMSLMHLLFWGLAKMKTIQQETAFKTPLFLSVHHHQTGDSGFLRLHLDYPGPDQSTPSDPVDDELLAKVRETLKSCRGELIARQDASGAFALQLDLPLI